MYYFGLILSIITVCYNAKEDLAQTVDSVLSQTWRNFEYIVVDGDSTDGTKEYLEQLKSYTLQQPLDYETGGKSYRIYYVPAAKSGSTDVSVPTDKEYSISGNNMDGFIVTVEMS